MKTNLLAQNDNLVIENLKADVGKSVENLSHSVTFPIDVDGAILPICCIETLPSDSFEISCECLLRQLSPLKVPLMTNLRLNTAFYYVDNRCCWKKWERFMTGGRSGNEVYDIPRVGNNSTTDGSGNVLISLDDTDDTLHINYANSLHTYFGVSLNINRTVSTEWKDYSAELPVAFPFFGYQMICRDYYTNVDRLPPEQDNSHLFDYNYPFADWSYKNLFPSDEDEIKLKDGAQLISGFDTSDDVFNHVHGFCLDKVRYHEVRPDYFSTSKVAPMRGDAPALSAVQSSIKLPSGTSIRIDDNNLITISEKTVHTTDSAGLSKSMRVVPDGQSGPNMPVIGDTDSTSSRSLTTDSQIITSISGVTNGDITLSGTLSASYTAADIRLLSQLTVWQELNMLHEPYYNDFLNAHFDNVRVGESPVEKPQYIGGTSQVISINEILQTSQSTDSSPLGNQGATAMSLANNYVGKYYSNNYGYIIGVAYIIPDMMYKPAMPRGFSRRSKEDYYSPEFANLSMQATLNKEIFFSNDDDWNNAPWGYTGAFDELRSIPNRIAGDLLNSSYTDLQKWVLVRDMDNDNKPSMSASWLTLHGNVDKTAWSVPTMPSFMLQCANYIKAVRPMPKIAIPKAL